MINFSIVQGVLTLLIAGIAVYIAYQQYQTNALKVRLDRYDRRLKVYEEVHKLLSLAARDAAVSLEDLLKFRVATSEAVFLFGAEIPEYLKEISTRGFNLLRWNDEYRDVTQARAADYDHQKVVAGKHEELQWLVAQIDTAVEKFKPYLDVSR